MLKIRESHVRLSGRCHRGGYLRNVCCHHWLSPSSWCQSLARPHSFPHQHQDHQGWLWLALVISCLVIILHISHLWQLFLLAREDEKKALSLSSATTNTKITTDRLWAWESWDGNVFRVWRHCARVRHCLLSAPSYSLDFLKGWYNQMLGRYTNKILVILFESRFSNNLNRHAYKLTPHYLDI